MGVALENARLFDETQRLFKETEQRCAELAIINSVQAALAAKLDLQEIYDAVGDKVRELFNQADVQIVIHDAVREGQPLAVRLRGRPANRPANRKGERRRLPGPRAPHARSAASSTRTWPRSPGAMGAAPCRGPATRRSAVYVPLVAGESARGVLVLSDLEREHAFSESDVRLLQTIAGSMAVALENARLFDETQRLLEETERQGREATALADVGRDLSSSLDLATVMDRIARHAKDLLHSNSSAIFLPERGTRHIVPSSAVGDDAEEIRATVIEQGTASSAACCSAAAGASSTTPTPTRGESRSPAPKRRTTSA